MPLTRKQGQKIVKAAGYSSVPDLAVKGGRAAASYALKKYRAYTKAKKAKEAAARKAAAEKGADTYKVPPKEGAKTMPKKKKPKSQLDRIKENQRRKRESLNY